MKKKRAVQRERNATGELSTIRSRILDFSTDAIDDPRVGTIIAGLVGDITVHLQHTIMIHVFLNGAGSPLASVCSLSAIPAGTRASSRARRGLRWPSGNG